MKSKNQKSVYLAVSAYGNSTHIRTKKICVFLSTKGLFRVEFNLRAVVIIMQPKFCPKCRFANKGTSTECTHCGYSFIDKSDLVFIESRSCYYHPERVAEAKCYSCNKNICAQDIRRRKEFSWSSFCLSGSICCAFEERKYCVDCYNLKFLNQSSERNLNGPVLKDR